MSDVGGDGVDEARVRALLTPEIAVAAWRRLPWRARLVLLVQKAWPRLSGVPFVRRWVVWAVVRMITEVALARKARREAGGLPDEVFVESRGDLLIRRSIGVVAVAAIAVRHVGYLVVSIGALALLIPFLLWPPWWPLIRSLFDVARRDAELQQRSEDQAARRDLEDDRDTER
jgi:hypothetical protein